MLCGRDSSVAGSRAATLAAGERCVGADGTRTSTETTVAPRSARVLQQRARAPFAFSVALDRVAVADARPGGRSTRSSRPPGSRCRRCAGGASAPSRRSLAPPPTRLGGPPARPSRPPRRQRSGGHPFATADRRASRGPSRRRPPGRRTPSDSRPRPRAARGSSMPDRRGQVRRDRRVGDPRVRLEPALDGAVVEPEHVRRRRRRRPGRDDLATVSRCRPAHLDHRAWAPRSGREEPAPIARRRRDPTTPGRTPRRDGGSVSARRLVEIANEMDLRLERIPRARLDDRPGRFGSVPRRRRRSRRRSRDDEVRVLRRDRRAADRAGPCRPLPRSGGPRGHPAGFVNTLPQFGSASGWVRRRQSRASSIRARISGALPRRRRRDRRLRRRRRRRPEARTGGRRSPLRRRRSARARPSAQELEHLDPSRARRPSHGRGRPRSSAPRHRAWPGSRRRTRAPPDRARSATPASAGSGIAPPAVSRSPSRAAHR